jgi:hypothetical protein
MPLIPGPSNPNSGLPWESQVIKWENAGGWSTEQVLTSLLDVTSNLQGLHIPANTLQGLNSGGAGLTSIINTTSTLQGIA